MTFVGGHGLFRTRPLSFRLLGNLFQDDLGKTVRRSVMGNADAAAGKI